MDQSTLSSSIPADRPVAQQPPTRQPGSVQARWDPPHPIDPSAVGPHPVGGDAHCPATPNHELIGRHAAELADHLRRWEADLSRRERRLHEQIGALELEQRQFRLWMHQTECQLQAQREALEQLRAATAADPFEFPS